MEGFPDESQGCATFAFMTNKQQDAAIKTASQPANIFDLYNIPANNIHYTLHNLFRGLKSIRLKYKLTINEIIFLNGMYLYCKHISTCISQDACLRFIGYYNPVRSSIT